jgi:hypothetical protein
MVDRLIPLTDVVTANFKIAPIAINTKLEPIRMSRWFWSVPPGGRTLWIIRPAGITWTRREVTTRASDRHDWLSHRARESRSPRCSDSLELLEDLL